jgi:hypothetical protein
MSYAPGTLFRAYNAGQHTTAIQLKDGSVLQVKNVRATYPSLDAWLVATSATRENLVVDTSKASGITVGADTHGFDYRRCYDPQYKWTNHCYALMLELTPHLLERADVRAAFNTLVDVCSKCTHSDRFMFSYRGRRSYTPYILNYNDKHNAGGFPYLSSHIETEKADAAALKVAYTALRPLIVDDLLPKLETMHQILHDEWYVQWLTQRVRRGEKKLAEMQYSVQYNRDILEKYKKKVAELRATVSKGM